MKRFFAFILFAASCLTPLSGATLTYVFTAEQLYNAALPNCGVAASCAFDQILIESTSPSATIVGTSVIGSDHWIGTSGTKKTGWASAPGFLYFLALPGTNLSGSFTVPSQPNPADVLGFLPLSAKLVVLLSDLSPQSGAPVTFSMVASFPMLADGGTQLRDTMGVKNGGSPFDIQASAVPEPATIGIAAAALAAFAVARRKYRS